MDLKFLTSLDPTLISLLALLVSVVSLPISLWALIRDTHKVKAYSYGLFGLDQPRGLMIVVSNHGKRPISIERVILSRRVSWKEVEVRVFPFSEAGECRIDVGQSSNAVLEPKKVGLTWENFEHFNSYKIQIEDALGKIYRAPYVGVSAPIKGL